MRFRALAAGGMLLYLAVSHALGAAPTVSEADAQLALRIASGLSSSAPPEMRVADVVSSTAEGSGPRVSILDAVQLLRGAHGFLPRGVTGTDLMQARDDVQLQKDAVRNFTLARAFRFSGRLLDTNGQPVPGYVMMTDVSGGQQTSAYADDGGRFSLPVGSGTLRPSVFSQYPASPGHSSGIMCTAVLPIVQVIGHVGAAQHEIIRPNKPPTGFITGAIAGGSYTPERVGAWVVLDGGESGSGYGFPKEGRFTVECPVGEANMIIEASTWDRGTATDVSFKYPELVKVEAGQTFFHDVGFPKLDTLTCVLHGAPRSPVHYLTLEPKKTSGGYLRSSIQDPKPSGYALPVIPGEYEFSVVYERHDGTTTCWRRYCKDVNVAPGGGCIDITIPAEPPNRTIMGIVRDPRGQPLGGAEVTLSRDLAEGKGHASVTAITDSKGRYTLTAPEGRYAIYVRPPR